MKEKQQKIVLKLGLMNAGQAGFSKPLFALPVINTDTQALYSGEVVQIDATYTGVGLAVKKLTKSTDTPYGIVLFNHFNDAYAPNTMLSVAANGSSIFCICGGIITLGNPVAWDVSNAVVIKSDGSNPNIGVALGHTDSANEFIEVQIRL